MKGAAEGHGGRHHVIAVAADVGYLKGLNGCSRKHLAFRQPIESARDRIVAVVVNDYESKEAAGWGDRHRVTARQFQIDGGQIDLADDIELLKLGIDRRAIDCDSQVGAAGKAEDTARAEFDISSVFRHTDVGGAARRERGIAPSRVKRSGSDIDCPSVSKNDFGDMW